jgi:hypothetical protein
MALAAEVYDDVAERPMADIDLRIERRHLSAALAVAEGLGFAVREYSRVYGSFAFEVGDTDFDVETTFGPPALCGLSVREAMAHARAVRCGDLSVQIPEVHDHALVLCVNAFKDKCVLAAEWCMSDLVRVGAHRDFDPYMFVARARAARSVGIVRLVARWLCATSDSAPWRAVRDLLEAERRPLRDEVYARAFEALASTRPRSLVMRALARAGADRARDRARALAAMGLYGLEKTLLRG